jgi:glycosyltransferase involved in cell wall biosynthesis
MPLPRVLVLTPMRNAAPYLGRYMALLEQLDYPVAQLSLGILEGDSDDETHGLLCQHQDRLVQRFRKVSLVQRHHGVRFEVPRWDPSIQRQRRALIAQARNRLLSAALTDEHWVLWLDSDLVDYPPHLLHSLLATGKDIVVPCCRKPDGRIFDMNTFIFSPSQAQAEDPRFLLDGLYQPPMGAGRRYLSDCTDQPLVQVDGVGGTALLVRASLHREGLVFPSWPHRGYIETEGLAAIAHDLGVSCWGLPQLDVVHADA